ncbi:MAG: antitoxin VapB family protein [Candidatus Korarchaeota archaeon]|nr:antitoxin VapB family protein [Candidatus Korarchaeota archaeon]
MGKVISVREDTYRRLKSLKERMRAKSLGETIDRLIDEYLKRKRERLKDLVRSSRLSEEEADKVEEIVKEVESREWW